MLIFAQIYETMRRATNILPENALPNVQLSGNCRRFNVLGIIVFN